MFCLPQSQTEVARSFRSLEQRVNDQCFMNDRLIGAPYFQAPNVSLNLFLVVDEIKIYKSTAQDSIVFAIPTAPGSCLVNLSTILNPQVSPSNKSSNPKGLQPTSCPTLMPQQSTSHRPETAGLLICKPP